MSESTEKKEDEAEKMDTSEQPGDGASKELVGKSTDDDSDIVSETRKAVSETVQTAAASALAAAAVKAKVSVDYSLRLKTLSAFGQY